MKPKFKILIGLGAIVVLCMSVGKTYTFLTNRTPRKYSVETYLQTKPPEKFLHLTDGEIDLKKATYASTLGVGPTTEAYLPLKPTGSQDDEPVQILVKTKNPEILQLLNDLRDVKTDADVKRMLATGSRSLTVLAGLMHKDFEGLLLDEDDVHLFFRLQLQSQYPKLKEHFLILDEGEKPDASCFFMFAWGIFLAAVSWRWLRKWWLQRQVSGVAGGPPPLPPPPPPGMGPPPLPPGGLGPPPLPG